MTVQSSAGQAVGWQRRENAAIAVAILVTVIVLNQPWWLLLVAFLAFDLSALGYLINRRIGAWMYNLVHNYTAPAVLIAVWVGLQAAGADAGWLALLACCWGFHVAVDRAVGYGLKLGPFQHTHLGVIGKPRPAPTTTAAA